MYTLHQLAGAVPRRARDNGQQQPWMSSHCAWWPFATLPHADAIVPVPPPPPPQATQQATQQQGDDQELGKCS